MIRPGWFATQVKRRKKINEDKMNQNNFEYFWTCWRRALKVSIFSRALLLARIDSTSNSVMSSVCPVVCLSLHGRTPPCPLETWFLGSWGNFCLWNFFFSKFFFHLHQYFPTFTFKCISGCFMPSWVLNKIFPANFFFFTQNLSSMSCGWSKARHNATKHPCFTLLVFCCLLSAGQFIPWCNVRVSKSLLFMIMSWTCECDKRKVKIVLDVFLVFWGGEAKTGAGAFKKDCIDAYFWKKKSVRVKILSCGRQHLSCRRKNNFEEACLLFDLTTRLIASAPWRGAPKSWRHQNREVTS